MDCDKFLTTAAEDLQLGYYKDFSSSSDTLVITFGGLFTMGVPPFEFKRIMSEFDVKRLFLRDVDRAWYQLGVRGLGEDVLSLARQLTTLRHEAHARRVVCLGASNGGFAAMMLGALIRADVVLAFGPQTSMTQEFRETHNETRWAEHYAKIHEGAIHGSGKMFLDAREVLLTTGAAPTYVWFPIQFQPDVLHAKHMAGVPNVTLCPFGYDHHDVVKRMRDTGHLMPEIRKAVEGPYSPKIFYRNFKP